MTEAYWDAMSMFVGAGLLALFVGAVAMFVMEIRQEIADQDRTIELEKKYRGTIR